MSVTSFHRRPSFARLLAALVVFAGPVNASAADALPETRWLPDQAPAVVVVRPAQWAKSPLGRTYVETGALAAISLQGNNRYRLFDPTKMERFTVGVSPFFYTELANNVGVEVEVEGAPFPSPYQARVNLKQLGLAMHNFHDANGHFPAAGGRGGKGDKEGLSWRVWLLPYVDQAPLFNQFKTDEPWDSPHNKRLIGKMPAIYKTVGVTDPEKTSLQVFTGPETPFPGARGRNLREFQDGTSYSLLVVSASPETAEIWTKPGGFPFDPKTCLEALGKLPPEGPPLLLGDGTARRLSRDARPEDLAALIRVQDGRTVDDKLLINPQEAAGRGLAMVVKRTTLADADLVAEKYPQAESVGAKTLYKGDGLTAAVVEPTVVLIGDESHVRRQLTGPAAPRANPLIAALDPEADLSLAFDLTGQKKLLEKWAQKAADDGLSNQLADLKGINSFSLNVFASRAKAGETFARGRIETESADVAKAKIAVLQARLRMLASLFSTFELELENRRVVEKMYQTLLTSAKFEQQGASILVTFVAPKDYARLPKLVEADLTRFAKQQRRIEAPRPLPRR